MHEQIDRDMCLMFGTSWHKLPSFASTSHPSLARISVACALLRAFDFSRCSDSPGDESTLEGVEGGAPRENKKVNYDSPALLRSTAGFCGVRSDRVSVCSAGDERTAASARPRLHCCLRHRATIRRRRSPAAGQRAALEMRELRVQPLDRQAVPASGYPP